MIDLNISMQASEILEYIRNASESTLYMTNDLVGKVAKNSRSAAKKIEGKALEMEGQHMYWRSGAGKWHVSTSKWDETSKSYRTPNRKGGKKSGGGDFRLEHFWFSKAAGPRNLVEVKAVGKLTSQIANLHDQDVHFPKGSVVFSYDTKKAKSKNGKWNRSKVWRRYQPGDTREGRNFFRLYEAEAMSTLPKSEEEVLVKWNRNVNSGVTK